MTHDELLMRVKLAGQTTSYVALLAVVKIHTPRKDLAMTCSGCDKPTLYPCPTIQAIERELV